MGGYLRPFLFTPLQGSGCSGLFSSSLAAVAPSVIVELNSGCSNSSGSVRSTYWPTTGHAMGLALFLPVHCLTFVSDLRLWAHYRWLLPSEDPESSPHFVFRHFKALFSLTVKRPPPYLGCFPPTMPFFPAGLLSAFKPPAYEDVVHRPGTPPPPYTAVPGCPLTASRECTCCSSTSSCPAHSEGTNVEGVSSHQSAPPHQEGEPGAGVSPAPTPASCRYRRLTGDSGIELCPCPDSSEREPVKEAKASAIQPDLGDCSPCTLSLDPIPQVPSLGLATSEGSTP